MNRGEISRILTQLESTRTRNLVIIDYGNVQKWERNLGWKIGIRELARLVKHMSQGSKFLRRFYYGSDYGPSERSMVMTLWSEKILQAADYNGFEICTKRVKYIHDANYKTGFLKKCNLDIEMAVDMIREQKNYDSVVLFSGDGDMACVVDFLRKEYNKHVVLFGARDHIGRELIDAHASRIIDIVLFAEDFDYRLNMHRHRP